MQDFYRHIGAYVRGELTGDDLSSFEKEMTRDSILKEAVEAYPLIQKGFELKEAEDAILAARRRLFNEQNNIRKFPYAWWRIAAAFIFFAVATILIYANLKYSEKAILKSAYDPPMDVTTFLSDTIGSVSLNQVIQLRTENRIEEAIKLNERIVREEGVSNEERFILAHLYFENKQFEKAKSAFTQLSELPLYQDNCTYHLALIALSTDHTSDKFSALEKIAADNAHEYQAKAKKVLDMLRHPLRKIAFD